jgi:hypothetical protein
LLPAAKTGAPIALVISRETKGASMKKKGKKDDKGGKKAK